jgi:prepilin-type N-terminal cleavage/methylation domain-containing protein
LTRRVTRGFTIIESLVAMVILTISFLSMASIVPVAFGFAARDSQRVQAASAGQIYLDQLRYSIASNGNTTSTPAPPVIAIDPGNSFAVNGTPAQSLGNFTITSACPLVSGSTYRWDCTVAVTWNDPSGNPRTVNVESYVTSQK